jgi:biotin transport system substrate-specific component
MADAAHGAQAAPPQAGWGGYRRARAQVYRSAVGLHWGYKAGLAAVFAGLTALSAQVAIPLPWTPVPFSLQPLAVLVTGAVLGRHYGLLSVGLYLLAGAVGLQVFADQSSSGLEVLTGYTSGYLLGFALAAYLVGWYVERRRRLLDPAWMRIVLAGLAAITALALVTLTWIAFQGGTFQSSWSATESYLWLFAGMAVLALAAGAALVLRHRGLGWEKLNLFVVMMAGIALMHVPGVLGLKLLWPFEGAIGWPEAVALGSTVFLPFDLVKAAVATALTVAFLPTRDDERHFLAEAPGEP